MKVDYSQGKIYKITNDYNDDIYIGSTCDTLVKRFSKHKKDINNEEKKHRKLYVLMNEIGFDRFRIQLICDYPCEDKYQLRQKEGEYIRQMGTLNLRIEGRTYTQYNHDNRDKNREYAKKNYDENKDEINEKRKEKTTCECGCVVARSNLLRHKKLQKHLELIKAQFQN